MNQYQLPKTLEELYPLALKGDECNCKTCFCCQAARKYTEETEKILRKAKCCGIDVNKYRRA